MSKRFRSFFRASLYIHHTYLIPQFVEVFFIHQYFLNSLNFLTIILTIVNIMIIFKTLYFI